MVYIEFFDKDIIENICSSITKLPEKVYLLGSNKKLLERHSQRYSEIFKNRGTDIQFIFKATGKNNLDSIVKVLSEIVESESECEIDLTGGDELFLVAAGIVFEKHSDKNIQLHRINIRNNEIIDCDEVNNNNSVIPTPEISVVENIKIYGGDVVFDSVKPQGTHIWDLNDDFILDIEKIWSICFKSATNWNIQTGIFEYAEKYNTEKENPLKTVAPLDLLKLGLASNGYSYSFKTGVINQLKKAKLAFVEETEDTLCITYKNEQVKMCLTKAGQALEMIVYLYALQAENNGSKIYNDVMTGVYIDWDGVIHTEHGEFDTENEIDVIMMHNMVPIFVSCKNGQIAIEELYKLNSVAHKFGGKYAKKVLVATALGNSQAANYLRQRARDMQIKLIEPINHKKIRMTDDDFKSELKKALKNAWN